jgi:two-component system, NarL family, sensor histidine kinase UhpB
MRIGDGMSRIKQHLPYLSIFQRIVIGNSIIIILGAVGGTLLTRLLTDRAADLSLIIFFAFMGTILSVLTNSWIISTALKPLRELRLVVNHIQTGNAHLDIDRLQEADPDIGEFARVLQDLLLQLEERNQQLRALSERAITAQEEERKNIARSLHDDTGQALSMLIINLERLENRLPVDESELRSKLEASRKLASDILTELRKIVYGLRPTMLDDLGLIPAIRWYSRSVLETNGIQVRMSLPDEVMELPSHLATTLFRIAQEGINNIMRHASAKTTDICLALDPTGIRLQVQDDGQGFDLQRAAGEAVSSQHLGLLGMQERAELVGGKVTVESVPGKGTRLQVFVPLPAEVECDEEYDPNIAGR